jgi:acyl-CoA synthetase (AMP-forming)/AMP-acid ligase II
MGRTAEVAMVTPPDVSAVFRANRSETWVDVIRNRTQHRPERVVYSFLVDGEARESRLPYLELEQRARAIAATLQQSLARGDRALLLYPPGLDYIVAFFGCLYAGVAAVPAWPPHPARLELNLPRLRSIVADVKPGVVMTNTPGLGLAEVMIRHAPEFGSLQWLATDSLDLEAASEWRDPEVSADSIALVQYTSGSTAAPKGVALSHGNLLHNSAILRDTLGHSAETVGMIWLPPYHDMGLIGGLLQPIYVGFPVFAMSPLHFLQRPLRWLDAISRYQATTSAGPNFAFELCVRRTTAEQRASLDLRSWETAIIAAEPINAATLERFVSAFAPCGFRPTVFRPSYGLAEATLMVTSRVGPHVLDGRERALVSCGEPRLGQQMVIVEPESGVPCPPDVVGEIWVAGPSVARGYWNRPEETEVTFGGRLAITGEGPFLRTGDLGFVRDAELFVTGRLKDLIIIRGRNHYPDDIEWTVARSHPSLRAGSGAAFSILSDGEEQLVVVQEIDREDRQPDIDAIVDAIRCAVMESHDVRVASVLLVRAGKLPRTTSGKIRRFACRNDYLSGALDGHRRDLPIPASDRA